MGVEETKKERNLGQSLSQSFLISQSLNVSLITKVVTSRRIILKEETMVILFKL